MASLHQRNRIVVFRLSQEEYNCLRSACAASGGRNMSDFTRTELLTLVQSDGRDSIMDRRFLEIERKLSELREVIQSLSERIAAVPAGFAGHGSPSNGSANR